MNPDDKVTYFAETDARNQRIPFGIKAKDRTRHVYVIGKTGMGKSTVLENMAVQDIRNGNGFAFLDPHGQSADLLLEYIPEDRMDDVLYFAPFDMEHPISFNIMEDVGYDKRHLVVSGLMAAFKKIWQDAWSARMEYILSNTLLALLEYPDSTLLSVNRMYSDKKFREKVVNHITDTSVKSFWIDEYAKYNDKFATEATAAIQNKVGQFTSNPLVRNIVGQPKSSFDIRKVMDERKIMIINLSKGRIGESNANLLGSLLITKIYLAAMSRADVGKQSISELPNFYLYVDEFQSFANESFADILSEARKYKLNLTIAHQYIEQMSDEVRAAVFGNVGTMLSFRVGATDAEMLEKEFAPVFLAEDIVNLGFAQIYLRLMIDGIGSQPFSAKTLPPLEKPASSNIDAIVERSREQFSRPRADVEEEIRTLVEMGREVVGGNSGGVGGGGNGNRSANNSGGNGSSNHAGNGGNNSGTNATGKNGHNNGHGNGGGEMKNSNSNGSGGHKKSENSNNHSDKNTGNRAEKSPEKENTKPMFDEKTKNELQAILQTTLSREEVESKKKDLIDSEKEEWDGDVSKDIKNADEKRVNEKSLDKNKANKKDVYKLPIGDPKKVSPENKNDLKSMLESLMGGSVEKTESDKPKTEHAHPKENSQQDHNQSSSHNIGKKGPREIPESELKGLLDV